MRLAIAMLVASLVILSGCATFQTDFVNEQMASDSAAQATTAEEATADQAASEANAQLLEEEDEVDIGEMI